MSALRPPCHSALRARHARRVISRGAASSILENATTKRAERVSSRFANPSAAQSSYPYSFRNAEKKPEGYPGFNTLKLNRSSLRELAKCLSGTRLEGLRARKRNFLSQHCEFLGLLGQRFELLA
jgi:hypothetical protein